VFFRRFRRTGSDSPRDLEKLGAALNDAVDRFGRELGRHRSRRKAGQSRGSILAARLSPPTRRRRWFEARWHPLRHPQEYRRGQAPTVLSRSRDRYGRPSYARDDEARAGGVAAWLRLRLLRLRGWLSRLRDRFRWRRAPRVNTRRLSGTGMHIGSGPSNGSDLFTALVLATTAGVGFEMMSARQATAFEPPPPALDMIRVSNTLEARVDEMANAVAIAEGYFADGDHDGRTLPHLLNNPGALKKPALGAADLPTWKETGLVEFPTPEMGWEALRHQIRLMLTGTSGIYAHTDSLISVGDKYADGDANWGVNVATTLGVPPAATLAELTPCR